MKSSKPLFIATIVVVLDLAAYAIFKEPAKPFEGSSIGLTNAQFVVQAEQNPDVDDAEVNDNGDVKNELKQLADDQFAMQVKTLAIYNKDGKQLTKSITIN